MPVWLRMYIWIYIEIWSCIDFVLVIWWLINPNPFLIHEDYLNIIRVKNTYYRIPRRNYRGEKLLGRTEGETRFSRRLCSLFNANQMSPTGSDHKPPTIPFQPIRALDWWPLTNQNSRNEGILFLFSFRSCRVVSDHI